MKTGKRFRFDITSFFQNPSRSIVWVMLGLALGIFGLSVSATAQEPFIIVPFDAPDASTGAEQGTTPVGIIAGGTIVGFYVDARGVNHGFLRSPTGAITPFDVRGAGSSRGQGTLPQDINALGEIAGYYVDERGVAHGFLRYPNGWIATFDVRHAGTLSGQGTFPYALNPEGAITGVYQDAANAYHGFLAIPIP